MKEQNGIKRPFDKTDSEDIKSKCKNEKYYSN